MGVHISDLIIAMNNFQRNMREASKYLECPEEWPQLEVEAAAEFKAFCGAHDLPVDFTPLKPPSYRNPQDGRDVDALQRPPRR